MLDDVDVSVSRCARDEIHKREKGKVGMDSLRSKPRMYRLQRPEKRRERKNYGQCAHIATVVHSWKFKKTANEKRTRSPERLAYIRTTESYLNIKPCQSVLVVVDRGIW